MANGFGGKKKHRLNRKKYLLKRRRRRHENAWCGIFINGYRGIQVARILKMTNGKE